MARKLKNIFLKSWFLALTVTLLVIFLLPDIFNKYKIELFEKGSLGGESRLRAHLFDIDHDGYSERIHSLLDPDGFLALQIFQEDGGLVDQWNVEGTLLDKGGERLIFGDYDRDSLPEIYVFHQLKDTVFLDCFEPMDKTTPFSFQNRFICELTRRYARPDPSINSLHFADINNDGHIDLLFSLHAGMSKFPRRLIWYDIFQDSLHSTKDMGNFIAPQAVNLDIDKELEIIGHCGSAGNVHDSVGYPYHDYSAWLMAFDHKLEFLFEPIEFPGFRSNIRVYPYQFDKEKVLVVFHNHIGPLKNFPKLMLFDKNGKLMQKTVFPESDKTHRILIPLPSNPIHPFLILHETGMLVLLSDELKVTDSIHSNKRFFERLYSMDLNDDGKNEYVIPTRDHQLLIYDHSFRHKTLFDFKGDRIYTYSYQILKRGAKPSLLFAQGKNSYYLLSHSFNSLYYFKYLIYAGIFLFIWLFILLIRKLQLIQLEKKNRIRNEIVQLQLKNMKNQMNPHFTFNVFNAIASKIRKENPKTYPDFIQFSKLIRNTLESSDKITRSLSEEISYLESYLGLEKLRFPDKFDYEIEIEDGIDTSTKVPKMILQTYVENAIKHGIRHKEGKGHIEVSITTDNKNITISIKDDGIGRAKAKELSTDSTGFGLQIMENYYKLFNEYNEARIAHEIIDLYDDNGEPSGTKVMVSIPLKFSYRI
ncbi:MAG: histidine kinase [Bacteroidales bacterium]|nr:histidine kinase [Bacteroidales bacterium]MCF8387157.1 histidine kinase [Bacteroidales bacterium]MCF8397628.1 histidine kinase [Bacteroidales bacterium]